MAENQDPTLPVREDLEDGNELDSEELLAAMAENAPEHQYSDVAAEEMEEEELLLDDSLSPLEKIFLYVKSDLVSHRVFIAKELSSLIRDVEISEAVEYVLPLMNSLGTDPEELVREVFAPEVDKIIWFYYSHCPLREATLDNAQGDNGSITSRPMTPQRPQTPQRPHTPQRPQTPIQQQLQQLPAQPQTPTSHLPYLSPAAFTPLLHILLLDQNTGVARAAQDAVQSLVEKILGPGVNPKEKELLEKETLEGVVLGIGKLDQEKVKREELNEWDADGDDTSVGAVTGGEEEAELGRMTMMTLISTLAPIVGPEKCARLFVPELDKMSDEPVFYVRKEAALALGSLSGVLPLDIITTKLLPIYDQFSNDSIWHVRRSCCLVLPTICSRLPEEMKAERAVKGIEGFAGDVSRSVRSAAGEIIGELIANFHPDGKVPESLVQHFLSLGPVRETTIGVTNVTGSAYNTGLGQRDPERPVICAYNFPAVVLTLGESRWDDLKDTYFTLTRDMQIKVRRSLACSLHEVAKVIGPSKTEQDLLGVFTTYLADMDEVKSGLMEHLADFIECLPQNTRNDYLPSLIEVWDGLEDPQWRLRDEIAKQIPELCRMFNGQSAINHILPLTMRAIRDRVASVRETAVASFPTLFQVVRNDESCFKDMINRICEFASDDSKFRSRVVFVQVCNALISKNYPKEEFAKHFLNDLEKLSSDRVINVRIALARLVGELCRMEQYYQDPSSRPSQINHMLCRLAEDTDVDVRGFVFPYLSPEERSKFLSSTIQAMAESAENGLTPISEADDLNSITQETHDSTPIMNNINNEEKNDAEKSKESRDMENGRDNGVIMGEIPIAYIRSNNVDNNRSSSGLIVSSQSP